MKLEKFKNFFEKFRKFCEVWDIYFRKIGPAPECYYRNRFEMIENQLSFDAFGDFGTTPRVPFSNKIFNKFLVSNNLFEYLYSPNAV